MDTLSFHPIPHSNDFKPLNAVNNGPHYVRHASDQARSNFDAYKAARIPFARTHDASFYATYGGEHTVDISAIFPNFDADETEPTSYDFACTDEYLLVTMEAGTQIFFRLGQKIEHYIKKFNIYPPRDFQKWARICEHIIRHYNEGFANGFHLDICYWEIWNEADMEADAPAYRRTWGGSKAEFFDLYAITAKHLKFCFPDLQIGGPALAGNEAWADEFLQEMQLRQVPIDFFSWHIYCMEPEEMLQKSARIRALLDKHGYTQAKSILNEWNYVCGWEAGVFTKTIERIISMHGAAFTLACMCAAQNSDIDMLMYYDARPCVFNGLFDFYTLRPLKGYFPFYWYGMLYGRKELRCDTLPAHIYALCGVDKTGKTLTLLVHYTNNDAEPPREIALDFGKSGNYEVYSLDDTHDNTLIKVTNTPIFVLKNRSCLMIKEI